MLTVSTGTGREEEACQTEAAVEQATPGAPHVSDGHGQTQLADENTRRLGCRSGYTNR